MLKASSKWWIVCYLAAILLAPVIYFLTVFSLFGLAGTMSPRVEAILEFLLFTLLPFAPLLLTVVLHIRAAASITGSRNQGDS